MSPGWGRGRRSRITVALTACTAVAAGLLLAGCGIGSVSVYSVGKAPSGAAVVDVDGDGLPDIAVTIAGEGGVLVLRQASDGLFGGPRVRLPLPKGSRPSAVAAGDFDGSGRQALVVANRGGDSISLFTTIADRAAPAATFPLGKGSAPAALAVADFNGDRVDDLLVTSREPTAVSARAGRAGCATHGCVLVFLGTKKEAGAGTLGLGRHLVYSGAIETDERESGDRALDPVALTAADLTGDGKLDIGVANAATGDVAIIPGVGNGTFGEPYQHLRVPGPLTLTPSSIRYPVKGVAGVLAVGTRSSGIALFIAVGPPGTPFKPMRASPLLPGHRALVGILRPGDLGGSPVIVDTDAGKVYVLDAVIGGINQFDGFPDTYRAYTDARAKGVDAIIPVSLAKGSQDVVAVLGRKGQVVVFRSGIAWSASATSLDFGTVAVGESAQRSLKLTIQSAAETSPPIPLVDRSPLGAGPFRATPTDCRQIKPPTTACTLTVTFTPTAAGQLRSTLTFAANGRYELLPGSGPISLTGIGGTTGSGTPASARARTAPLAVGVTDDTGKYADDAGAAFYALAKGANLDVVRVSAAWPFSALERAYLAKTVALGKQRGLRIFLSAAPSDPKSRDAAAFCADLADLVRTLGVTDVIVGNEPNKQRFFGPTFGADGSPAAPRAYTELLAACYAKLKALAAAPRVIGAGLAPFGNDNPKAKSNLGLSPVRFLLAMGAAYRDLGLSGPIMDALAFHPYPNQQAKPPPAPAKGAEWPNASFADLARVKQAFEDAFGKTPQPTFRDGKLELVLDETGWQADTTGLDAIYGTAPETSPTVSADTQADYYRQVVLAAACDPDVESLLFFRLVDERDRSSASDTGGWQSGLVLADGATQRPSYAAVRDAIAQSGGKCQGTPTGWAPSAGVEGATVDFTKRTVKASEPASWRAAIVPQGAAPSAVTAALAAAGATSGSAPANKGVVLRQPARKGLKPGAYVTVVRITAQLAPGRATDATSAPFTVR